MFALPILSFLWSFADLRIIFLCLYFQMFDIFLWIYSFCYGDGSARCNNLIVDNRDVYSLSLQNNDFAPVTYWYAELEVLVQHSKNNEKRMQDIFRLYI